MWYVVPVVITAVKRSPNRPQSQAKRRIVGEFLPDTVLGSFPGSVGTLPESKTILSAV